MPGLINTHIGMSLFRTLADDTANRLKKYLFLMEKKFVTPDLVFRASLYTLTEMIEGGTTTFADMYYFEDVVADATIKAGLRGILGESVLNLPSPDAKEPYGGFEYTKKFINSYSNHPLITPALAPHAPYSLDFKNLKKTAELAEEWDIPILSHLAEMSFETRQIAEKYKMSPVELYSETGEKADIIIISTESTSMFPIYDYYSALVYCASPRDVNTVIVSGEIIMEDRQIKTFSKSETKTEAEKIVIKIKKELKNF